MKEKMRCEHVLEGTHVCLGKEAIGRHFQKVIEKAESPGRACPREHVRRAAVRANSLQKACWGHTAFESHLKMGKMKKDF